MAGTVNPTEEATIKNLRNTRERDFATPPDGKTAQNVVTDEKQDVRDDGSSGSESTATNSEDEFDWDDEGGDAAVEEAKDDSRTARRGRAAWLLFMKLARPLRVLIIGTIGCGIFVTPFIVTELQYKDNIVTPQVHVWSIWLTVIWAAGCITSLLVQAIPKILIRLIVLFGGHVELFKIQLELVLAVTAWLKLALNISWAWIALSVIRVVYKPQQYYWVIVNRVLQALFTTGVILLVEKIALRYIAINFHRKALSDRLTENRIGLKALDRLSNAEPVVKKKMPYNPRKGHISSSFSGLDISKSHSSTDSPTINKNNPLENPESPVTDNRKHHRTTHSERRKSRKKAMASVIVDTINELAFKDSEFHKQMDLGSLASARKLARKLFQSLSKVHPDRSALIETDFHPYFRTTEEAKAAFVVFDKDGNGDISKREMRDAVQRIYRERKSLAASLKDVGSAVAKLDGVLVVISLVFIFFICLLIFNPENTIASLVPLDTIILGFSFVFGSSATKLFESLLFIFSTHVFDVGDLVMIDDQPLIVREFGLFSTTFRRVDGQEIIAPNSLLAGTKMVHNLRRSTSQWETTNLMVSYDTPLQVLDELRARYRAYIAENTRDWAGCDFNIDHMDNQNVIHIIVAMQHRANWQDWGGRWTRRTALMRNLKTILEELEVKYTMPVQPILLPPNAPWASRANTRPSSPGFTLSSPGGMRTQIRQSPRSPAINLADTGNAGHFGSTAR